MRYVSKEARRRAFYRTLLQWVKIVRIASGTGPKDARQQILDGLIDGQFSAALECPYGDLRGDPPSWDEAEFNWRTGKVKCDQRLMDVGHARLRSEAKKGGRSSDYGYWCTLLLMAKSGTVFERLLTLSRNEPAPVVRLMQSPDWLKLAEQTVSTPVRRKRAKYVGDLEKFTARYSDAIVDRMSDDAVARQYLEDCARRAKAGETVPELPADRRNIATQVSKIRAKRLSKDKNPP